MVLFVAAFIGQIHRVWWFSLLPVQDARVSHSSLWTKTIFYQISAFLIWKTKITPCDLNYKFRVLFPVCLWDFCPSRCPCTHPKVQSYWGVYTSVCTAGATLSALPRVEPSRALLGRKLRKAIQRDMRFWLVLHWLLKEALKLKVIILHLINTSWEMGKYVWRRKAS